MSDGSNETLVGMHVASYETIVIDFVRKLADSYTRISILERALGETRQKRDELQALSDTTQMSLQQAVNGLTALKGERDELFAESQRQGILNNGLLEKLELLEEELSYVKDRLAACTSDSETLKNNYKAVVNNLSEVSKTKSIKAKSVSTDECINDDKVQT